MLHPFMPDVSDKTSEELQKTIFSLNNKLSFACRMGNPALINQLQMILEGYRQESSKKLEAQMKNQNIDFNISVENNERKNSV